MDQRDSTTWIAIELSRYGETKVEDGTIEDAIRQDLSVDADFPIFIPATTYPKGHRRITIHLLEGYVFVGTGLPEVRYFALEQRPYIAQVISIPTGKYKIRTPSVIPDSKVEEMRAQLRGMVSSDIEKDALVRITQGIYRTLEGQVMDVEDNMAFVYVELRSLKLVATIPRIFLEVLDEV